MKAVIKVLVLNVIKRPPPNGYINFIYKKAPPGNIRLIYRCLYWCLYTWIHIGVYTGAYIGYIREFMYLIFYIYTLSLFLSYLYLFFIFGRERKKDIYIRMVGRVAEWQAWQSKYKYLYTKENLEIQWLYILGYIV